MRKAAIPRRIRGLFSCLLVCGVAVSLVCAAASAAPGDRPVAVIADATLLVRTAAGEGALRLIGSQDLSKPDAGLERAVIMIHGVLRDADDYFRTLEKARAAAGPEGTTGVVLVAPQFLADVDASARGLSPDTLRWSGDAWMGGETALAPAPISSYEALDALLARLGDRTLFPGMREIVVAGHSGGGQVVQRYAATSRAVGPLAKAGISIRFVVASPSSYLYFSPDRPQSDGGFAPADSGACPKVDRWKYGLGERPPYAADRSGAELEQAYLARDVTLLLGSLDTNPHHPALDVGCAAEAQGATRLARGLAYARYLAWRDGAAFRHVVREVPGVGHDGEAMFTSPLGVAALFGPARP